jgi:hypothetical protein
LTNNLRGSRSWGTRLMAARRALPRWHEYRVRVNEDSQQSQIADFIFRGFLSQVLNSEFHGLDKRLGVEIEIGIADS